MLNPFKHKRQQRPVTPTPQWLKWGVLGFIVLILLVNSQSEEGQPSPLEQVMNNIAGELPKTEDYSKLIPNTPRGELKVIAQGEGRPALCGQTMQLEYAAYHAEQQVSSGVLDLINMPGGDMSRLASIASGLKPGGIRRIEFSEPTTIGHFIADDSPEPITALEFTLVKLTPDTAQLFKENELGIKLFDEQIGEGKTATCGDEVAVQYKAYHGTNSHIKEGKVSFVIGSGKVIAGLEQGAIGMQPGGKRTLILPSAWQQHLYKHPELDVALLFGAKKQLMVLEVTLEK